MIKNSLLHAYKKRYALERKIAEGQYHERLQNRLDKNEINFVEYDKACIALKELHEIDNAIEDVFVKPGKTRFMPNGCYKWQEYYRRADQLLYGRATADESEEYFTNNDTLINEVVAELNKHFPSEQWKYGVVPLYNWQKLNYPGYEVTASDIEEWENDPTVQKMSDGWYRSSAKNVKAIFTKSAQEELLAAQHNLTELSRATKIIEKTRQLYIVDNQAYNDRECGGGYDLFVQPTFKENLTVAFGVKLTPQEQVINQKIVSEIDKWCANRSEIATIHQKLDVLVDRVSQFAKENNLRTIPLVSAIKNTVDKDNIRK